MKIKLLASICLILGCTGMAKADITLGYPSPNQINIYQYCFLDVNVDGINDFFVMVQKPASNVNVTIKGLNGSQIETDGSGKVMALSPSAPVGNNSWQDSAVIYSTDLGIYYFPQGSNRFAGLRVLKNGNYYNAYLELAVSGNTASFTCFLIKHGCETTPDWPILANSNSSIANLNTLENNFKLSLENECICFNLDAPATVSLFDINGRILWREENQNGEQRIPASDLHGVYFVRLSNFQGKELQKKIVL